MTARTVGIYTHSDATTPNKGAALAAVTGSSAFAPTAARLAFGAGAASWGEVLAVFPEAEATRASAGADVGALAVMRLAPAEAGRVEAAVVGDVAALVKVRTSTDFAAKTTDLVAFARKAADLVARLGAWSWAGAVAVEPALEAERQALAKALKETVEVADVVTVRP